VFVLGDRLAKIDTHSGRVRWSRPVPDVGGGSGGDPANDLLGDAGAGMMAIIGQSGVAGLDRASGHIRWTKPWPADCSYLKDFSSVAIVARTLAITCGNRGHLTTWWSDSTRPPGRSGGALPARSGGRTAIAFSGGIQVSVCPPGSPITGDIIDIFDDSGGDDLFAERPDLHTSHNLSR
jgi:hypothetical protein